MRRFSFLIPVLTLAPAAMLAAEDGPLEVIFSEATGATSATVPGALDLAGAPIFTEFKALEDLTVSPDGQHWLVKGRSWLGSDLETILLKGSGANGTMFVQEGQPIAGGLPGELWDFFDGAAAFDDAGNLAFGGRAREGDSSVKEKVLFYDTTLDIHSMVVTESTPVDGLEDLPPDPSGDELLGNSLNSIHLLNDGTVGYVAVTIQNVHSSRRPAIFFNTAAFLQSGVSEIDGDVWDSFDSDGFTTTPDGNHVLIMGDDEGSTATDDILVSGGAPAAGGMTVVLREGDNVPGTSDALAAIFNAELHHSGAWFARGDFGDDTDWAVTDGTLVARTGDPITDGATEQWGAVFLAFNGNGNGDWVLAGSTDGSDPERDSVLVLNGQRVLVREGDPVDLDGNGAFDDDAFIGRGNASLSSFNPNDLVITDDKVVYFIAPLRNSKGQDLGSFGSGGDAFLRLELDVAAACIEDIAGDDGTVDTQDLLLLLAGWGTDGPGADIAAPANIIDTADLLGMLAAWGDCR